MPYWLRPPTALRAARALGTATSDEPPARPRPDRTRASPPGSFAPARHGTARVTTGNHGTPPERARLVPRVRALPSAVVLSPRRAWAWHAGGAGARCCCCC
eukprot:scaffold1314_cov393-Prasinococcus_capsulatus_cf.AAC.1